MLPKKLKIDRISFPSHKEKKYIWSGTALRIYCYPAVEKTRSFAVIVSKKQLSTHIAKNAFKRAVFNEVSLYQHVFNLTPFGKFVFYPITAVESISRNDIHETISVFLKEYVPTKPAH